MQQIEIEIGVGIELTIPTKRRPEMTIHEGKAAPAFSLPDAQGNNVALKDFRGKHVVVYFYPKDNTSG